MTLIPLDSNSLPAFFDYCRKYGPQHDESFLNDEELTPQAFPLGADEPAFILLSPEGAITGAASLMLKKTAGQKIARLRIFHTISQQAQDYRQFLDALIPFCAGLDSIFLFLPENLHETRAALEQSGFTIQRYSLVLRRPHQETGGVPLPPGFTIRQFDWQKDMQDWCDVRNSAFKVLLGFTELKPENMPQEYPQSDFFAEGMLMLYDGEKPVGTVQAATDTGENGEPEAWIYSLAVRPEYQGRGLGRSLLCAAIDAGYQHGLLATCLCVNAENDRAAALYLGEGFQKVQSMVCYQAVLI